MVENSKTRNPILNKYTKFVDSEGELVKETSPEPDQLRQFQKIKVNLGDIDFFKTENQTSIQKQQLVHISANGVEEKKTYTIMNQNGSPGGGKR